MIVFNTNQLNHFSYKSTAQQKPTNFNSQFDEKVKHGNNVIEHYSKRTPSQQTVKPSLALLSAQFNSEDNKKNGQQYFKSGLSLMTQFAIKQYETFANFEAQQERASMLSLNEYA